MKKVILALTLVMGLSMAASAQNYTSAIGLRLGYPTSVSYKHFISDQGALEGFLGFRSYARSYSWVTLGLTYQHHWDISGVDGLSWYAGGGLSAFFWNYKDNFIGAEGNTSIGVLGALGLDYKFDSAPVNLSLDWLPIFFVNGYGSGFGGGYGALSVRYVLK